MIMAGGSGTRLWPLSRRERPKQLLPLIADGTGRRRSLLECAAQRIDGLVAPERRLICTAERFRALIRDRLPAFGDEQILGEPCGRDTLNAVALTASVLHRRDPDAVFSVLTADHLIEPEDTFRARMEEGYALVEEDPSRLVTFSITPTEPATGYGYVRIGAPIRGHAHEVAEFVEKPDRRRAERYVASGEYGWNSGMFVFHARTIMDALARLHPENHRGIQRICDAWDTPDRVRVLEEVYPRLPATSVDYGIMEPASDDPDLAICCVTMDVRWLDVGSWPSFARTLEPDKHGNRTTPEDACLLVDSTGCLVVQEDETHTLALLGCEDLVVVRSPDATLVMPLDRAQDLKRLHGKLGERLR